MNFPSPRYMPVCVMCFAELPKYSRSPGCRSLRSTGASPSQSACGCARTRSELPFTKIHARVRDVFCRAAEIQQVARLQVLALDGCEPVPIGLRLREDQI